jgi:hypothetical protein
VIPVRGRFRGPAAALLLVASCRATTSRPSFTSFPEAVAGELGLGQPNRDSSVVQVTRLVVGALRADSFPLARVHEFDGFIDSGWLDAATLAPTSRRPLGPEVVRVRGWVDPGKPGFSRVDLETIYVPVADPSRPARDLEAPAPPDHPVTKRVAALMKTLVDKYGDPAERERLKPAPGGPPLDSTARAKQPPAPPARDTTTKPKPAARNDSTARRDTTRA